MKNREIIALCNAGALQLQALTLDAAQAYKVYKFRKALDKAYNGIIEHQRDLIKEAGIEDVQKFSDRLKKLRDLRECAGKGKEFGPEEQAELDRLEEQDSKLGSVVAELFNDETALEGCRTLPYEAWHKLRQENKLLADNGIESLLLGVLWAEPEEEQEQK